MSQRLIILDEAEEELTEAETWYEKQRVGLGQEFRIAIDEGWSSFSRHHLPLLPSSTFPRSLVPDEFLLNDFPTRSSSSKT